MMLSRACARPAHTSMCIAESSGPRCLIAPIMRPRRFGSMLQLAAETMPAMPHTLDEAKQMIRQGNLCAFGISPPQSGRSVAPHHQDAHFPSALIGFLHVFIVALGLLDCRLWMSPKVLVVDDDN